MRIVFMGTPEFAVASLDAMNKHSKHEIVGVVTVPDKPSGRGQNLSESAVKKYAREQHIPVLQPEKLRDSNFLNTLKSWNADLFVVVAFRWLPREVWSIPEYGTINLHGSLLPQYRGAAPINRAVMNGETETGVTTFLIDKEIDTGKILLSERISIASDENAGSVHDRMMVVGANLLLKTVDGLAAQNIVPKSQETLMSNSENLKSAPKIFREDCQIDWNQEAQTIYNQIRGLSPYPGAFTTLKNENGAIRTLKIFQVADHFLENENNLSGTLKIDKSRLFIACKNALLELLDVQIDGKKRMKTADFLRGIDIKSFIIGNL